MNEEDLMPPLWKRIIICLIHWREWQACLKHDREAMKRGATIEDMINSQHMWAYLFNK